MPAQFIGLRRDPDGLSGNDADRTSRDGAKIVAQAHGKYLEQAIRNRIYTGVSAVGGIALITTATTGNHPTLWNPSDSGRYLSVVRLVLGYVSGNNAPTSLAWYTTLATGASAATAAPIATLTRVAPVGVVGGSLDNKGVWSPTTNTFTAAPTYYRSSGLSLFTGVAATAAPPFLLRADYDGDLVLAPGTAISLCSVAATTTAVFQIALSWEEVDV
jgi:hypothetical protein